MHGVGFPTPVGPLAPKTVQTGVPAVSAQQAAAQEEEPDFFSFDSLLDIVNPLQHLPVIGTLYRAITGDKMHVGAKLAGDGLYGGPMGLLSSIADTLFEKITGKNVGDTVLAFFTGEDSPNAEPAIAVAENKPVPLQQTSELDIARFLPTQDALDEALNNQWTAADLALRTRQAYARAQMLSAPAANIVS